MKDLTFEAVLKKDGEERAWAAIIAGWFEIYTGRKPESFSVSYNVRRSQKKSNDYMIIANLAYTLKPGYLPIWNLMQELLIEKDITFEKAVEHLMTRNVTSSGFVIVGGLEGNQGVSIARDPIGTHHTQWLSEKVWYIAQTNTDVPEETEDDRYNATIGYL